MEEKTKQPLEKFKLDEQTKRFIDNYNSKIQEIIKISETKYVNDLPDDNLLNSYLAECLGINEFKKAMDVIEESQKHEHVMQEDIIKIEKLRTNLISISDVVKKLETFQPELFENKNDMVFLDTETPKLHKFSRHKKD